MSTDPFGRPPPEALKRRVVGTLRGRGLVTPPPLVRAGRLLAAAALAVGLFTLGALYGRSPSTPTAPGPRYALLLYDHVTPPDGHGAADLVAEYTGWADSLRRHGALALGEKLADDGRLLAAGDLPATPDGAVTGLFIIRAADLETAVAIARTCPHLRHGGRIAVRPIEGT